MTNNIVVPPGVSAEIAAERNYRRIESERQLSAYDHRLTERQCQIPGLLFPAYRLGASSPYTYVLRPDTPRVGYDGKLVKYEWPERVQLCLDMLPRYRDALADPTVPVWITEGAKKADALASAFEAEIVPINISGVWGWRHRSKDGASHPLDDLDAIAWAGREVVLAFDNDVIRKPEVQQALRALARHLIKERGASVRVLVLPQEGDQKIGVDDALAAGMPVDELQSYIRDIDALPRPPAAERTWLTEDELDSLPPPAWLVDQEIAANGLTVLYGASGGGKTFVALDYALRVAQTGPVLYLAAEDVQGIAIRKRAWREFHQNTAGTFYVWPEEVNLLNPAAVDDFIDQIQPLGLKMFLVDTLHQCLIGGSDSNDKDMGTLIYSCKRIQRATGAAPLLIHHTGKNGSGERGSSALRAAAYTMLELTNEDGLIRLSCDKAKNSTPFADRYLRLYETGGSCVVVPAESVIPSQNAPLTSAQRKVLETLNYAIFENVGAKASELERATTLPHNTMFRTLSWLKQRRYIEQSVKGDPYYITDAGRAALNRASGSTTPAPPPPTVSETSPEAGSTTAVPHQEALVPSVPSLYHAVPGTASAASSTKYHAVPPPLKGGTDGTGTTAEKPNGRHETDLDHDRRREHEVDHCLAHDPPLIKKARAAARHIRGNKDRERVEDKIDAAEDTAKALGLEVH